MGRPQPWVDPAPHRLPNTKHVAEVSERDRIGLTGCERRELRSGRLDAAFHLPGIEQHGQPLPVGTPQLLTKVHEHVDERSIAGVQELNVLLMDLRTSGSIEREVEPERIGREYRRGRLEGRYRLRTCDHGN